MDTLALTAAILEELQDWCQSSPDASRYSPDFYARVERILRSISRASISPESVNARYHSLQRLIFDSGPLSSEFLPSLAAFEDTLQVTSSNSSPPEGEYMLFQIR